jgi:hypothetical protein
VSIALPAAADLFVGSGLLNRIHRTQVQRRCKVEKEQLAFKVDGKIKLRHDPWADELELVLTDASLTPCGRKRRDVVLRLTPDQWRALGALIPQQERFRYLLQTARAEMKEWWEQQREDTADHKHELIHKLGMDDWPEEELPYCLQP